MIQNNLAYQREKCLRSVGNSGPAAATTSSSTTVNFQYAVRSDGSTLGEELWKQRRQVGQPYVFVDTSAHSHVTAATLESMVQNVVSGFQRQVALPPAPPARQQPLHLPSSSSLQAPLLPSQTASSNLTKPNTSQWQRTNPYNENHHPNRSSYGNSTTTFNPSSNFSSNGTGTFRHGFAASESQRNLGMDDEEEDDDNFDDSVLANLDVDQVVSQHRQTSGSSNVSHGQAFAAPAASRSSDTSYPSHPSSMGSSSFATHSRVPFDYGNTSQVSSSHSWGTSINPHDPSFNAQGCNGGNEETYSAGYSNNDHTFHQQQPVDSNTPLCDGHSLPARLLTANTSSNMGRQFYKCSLPEGENCGFFQWQDGMEGNWNNNDSNIGGSFSGRGEIRDMYEGNRRVFGHQSFREGQEEVISKAIQGRDVFVLMPTG
jgi:GRF zinc finger